MKVYVYKQKHYFGFLQEKNSHEITFTYANNIKPEHYIEGINKRVNEYSDLPLVFKNLFLENSDLDNIKANTQIERLLFLQDIHGSYEFSKQKLNFSAADKTCKYEAIKAQILDNNYQFPNILPYNLKVSEQILKTNSKNNIMGLSGYQHKFSIIKDDENQEIRQADNESEYFMKPYNEQQLNFGSGNFYTPCLLINEHLFMTLARDLGFAVPYNAIIKGKNDYHYIIKRFDRFGTIKFDHEEFATLLGLDTNSKYNATITKVLEKASSYLSADKIKELLAFIFYSALISHGDLHSKNIALIHKSNAVDEIKKDIAPYYDISTTAIYKRLKANDIGMMFANKTTKITKKDFLEMANRFKIADFKDEMHRICKYFIANFKGYIEKFPDDIKTMPIVQSKYGKTNSLEFVLNKYYEGRCKYIKEKIDANLFNTQNIWQ